MSTSSYPSPDCSARFLRSPRSRRLIAAALAPALLAGISFAAASPAGAATAPKAQSAGRFVDGTIGGKPIESVLNLKGASAVSPGTTTTQNPLDATVLNTVTLPLTNALQLPGSNAISLGAANQVAQAKSDGYSYGASGAVNNSGGVSVGGNNAAYPADASVNLSADAVSSALGSSLPTLKVPGRAGLPSLGSLAALGSVKASVGAVSALAQTQSGGKIMSPEYDIANLNLQLSSPALGGLLTTLTSTVQPTTLTALLTPVVSALGSALPASCRLTSTALSSTISLDNGAVVIDPSTATVTVNLSALLATLRLNLNNLPANTDLIDYVVKQLPTVLTTGLEGVVNGITHPLEARLSGCVADLGAAPLSGLLGGLLGTFTTTEASIVSTLNTVASTLNNSGPSGLGALTTSLKQIIDIGVNVQPNGPSGTFRTALTVAGVSQAEPAVAGQSVVRAIEIDLIGDPLAVLALGNAAAGPSALGTTPHSASSTTPSPIPTTNPTTTPQNNQAVAVPTGVPAGYDKPLGHSELWLILLIVGVILATSGLGVTAGRRLRHR